jgi:hypothetical protein
MASRSRFPCKQAIFRVRTGCERGAKRCGRCERSAPPTCRSLGEADPNPRCGSTFLRLAAGRRCGARRRCNRARPRSEQAHARDELACWRARIYRITAEPALTKIVRSSWSDTRLDLDGVAGALGGGSDERPNAEVLHVPLREPAVVFAELRRGVLAAVDAGHERPARVVVLPLGEVVDLASDDDPAVVERRVLRELLACDGPVAGP